ncbi:MAG: UMP kinase [Spirochaetales bacterium]|nr:UMP kinase [Spirochaetales bacterium]
MNTITVLSIGGSIVAPDKPDINFLKNLRSLLIDCAGEFNTRYILVVGGGGPAREYQQACRLVCVDECDPEALDRIGIMATRLNAALVREIMSPYCADPVVTDPGADFPFSGSILVAAGWKPGRSTDFIAVSLAERFGAGRVINLSNIKKVYSADPKLDPSAVPLDHISWEDYRNMTGSEWTPGKNTPFDPVATVKAAELDLQVICAEGRDIDNTRAILSGQPFEGTIMGKKK